MKKAIGLSLMMFLLAGQSFGRTQMIDQDGVSCYIRAAELARTYFEVVDIRGRAGFAYVGKEDQIEITKYESLTPGSYDQEYLVEAIVKFDRVANRYAPEQDHKVKFIMTGDYDCDGLKVKSFKDLTK